jgi:SAM-dependent methyltransferase
MRRMELSGDVARNRLHWDRKSDDYQAAHGEQLARHPMAWGMWSIAEDQLHVLGDVRAKDVLELGCGGAQWSIALMKRGARCVGLDNSARQLEHARRNQRKAAVDFPLVQASAESVPFPDSSFDIIFCDHGAMSFTDPFRSVPEAAQLLRPGGLLAFSAETPLHFICWNEESDSLGTTLKGRYFDRRRADDGSSVCFSLPYGEWIALFRRSGFLIESLIELRPPQGATTSYGDFATFEWADSWPAEQIWRVRRQRSANATPADGINSSSTGTPRM